MELDAPLDNVLSLEDREMLVREFSVNEVKTAIFCMKHNKAPGSDGFPVEFYQKFWKLVSRDVMLFLMIFM